MTLKITGGIYKGRKLFSPPIATRPTQSILRQAVFNICQRYINNASFLDLFSGSGIMGLEALSRGATLAVLIENNKEAFICIKKNIALLKTDRAVPFFMDAKKIKTVMAKFSFDIAYIDPPYSFYETSFSLIKDLMSVLINNKVRYIFLEEPINNNKTPIVFDGLKILSKRKYGSSFLSHYMNLDFICPFSE
jgi:16S rRNA (guanine966-N2)-methyltransferase